MIGVSSPGWPSIRPINCAICGKAVESYSSERNEENMTVVITARCHGDEDSCIVSDLFWMEFQERDIVDITAFGSKRISQ